MSSTVIKPVPDHIESHFFKKFIQLCNSGKYLLQLSHYITQDMIYDNKKIMINHTIFNGSFFENIELLDIQLREFIYMVHKDMEMDENIDHIETIKNQDEKCIMELNFDITKIEIYDSNKKVNVIPFHELKHLFSTPKNVKMILQPIFITSTKNNIYYFSMKIQINKIYY